MRKSEQFAVDEKNVYIDVYRLLIAGMIVSSIFFVVGLVLALLHPRYFPLSSGWIRQQYHWGAIRRGLVGDPTTFLMIATVLLILTPVARVIVSIYAFIADNDRKYVVVTSIVFFIMVLTVVLGLFGIR